MAFEAGDILVRIEGTLASAESWANVWAFKDVADGTEAQAVADALHAFYADIADPWWMTPCSAVNASYRDLFGGGTFGLSWTTVTGATDSNLLPTECALRLSIRTLPLQSRGGPFLPGFGENGIQQNGTLLVAAQSAIKDALDDLATALAATTSPARLGLHRPTTVDVVAASSVRTGLVFDAIRRRRNDLPENYVLSLF